MSLYYLKSPSIYCIVGAAWKTLKFGRDAIFFKSETLASEMLLDIEQLIKASQGKVTITMYMQTYV